MKMMYNGTQIKSLNVNHYELSSNDCDMIASDLQAGKTAVARGKKITGTGKSFEFANYGQIETNQAQYIPSNINVVEITSLSHPIKNCIALNEMKNVDFTVKQHIGDAIIDGSEYAISVQAVNNFLTLFCTENISLEIFYGKDNYV